MTTEAFEKYLPQLRDALERYDGDENFATEAAVCLACAAIAGEAWAQHELDTNPKWALRSWEAPGGAGGGESLVDFRPPPAPPNAAEAKKFGEFMVDLDRAAPANAFRERRRLTARMLQSLDAYWLHCDGLPPGRYPRGRYDAEEWFNRFERYRAELETLP